MKKYGLSFLFLFLSILLFSLSTLIGSYIDSNGMLIEPAFFCIPFGLFLLILSIFTAIYAFTKQKF